MSKHVESSTTSARLKAFVNRNAFLIVFFLLILVIGGMILYVNNKKKNAPALVYGDDEIDMYYFHLNGCPHCAEQAKFNDKMIEKYPNLKIIPYEISEAESKQKYLEFAKIHPELSQVSIGTPTTVIGNRTNVGFGTELTSGPTIESMIIDEQKRIDANWNDATMKRTIDLRREQSN